VERSVADSTEYLLADWKGEAGSRVLQSSARPLSERSEDMSRSDRERAEGFHLSITTAVTTIATAVAESPAARIYL